jgi:hypothetical protein
MMGLLLFGVILGPHVLELFGDNHPVANFFAELGKLLLRGEVVPDALLAHLAPLGWQHINLTGDYLWDPDATLGPDGFRRLRTTSIAPLAAAA